MNIRLAAVALVFILLPIAAFAHCDTMSGPVVTDAKKAIALHDVTPVLKWIGKTDEAEVRRLFEQTMSVRQLSPASQEIADRFFFETVVRKKEDCFRKSIGEHFVSREPLYLALIRRGRWGEFEFSFALEVCCKHFASHRFCNDARLTGP